MRHAACGMRHAPLPREVLSEAPLSNHGPSVADPWAKSFTEAFGTMACGISILSRIVKFARKSLGSLRCNDVGGRGAC